MLWQNNMIRSLIFAGGLWLFLELLFLYAQPSAAVFASPREILAALPQFLDPDGHLIDLALTLVRTLISCILSIILGLAIGLFIAKSLIFRPQLAFIVDFLRSMPATALVPLFLVIFGTGSESKIAAGAFSGTLIVAMSVILGYRSLDTDRLVIADMIGLSGSKRVLYYEIFEVLPSLLVGARGAASLCLVLVVVAEMFVGGDGGLGRVIQDMRYSDDIPTLYGAIIVSGLVGYIMNLMFIAAEMRIVRFMGKS